MDEMRADMPFKTRFQLLGRCPFEPGEVVPMVKSHALVQVLVLSGGALSKVVLTQTRVTYKIYLKIGGGRIGSGDC